VLPDEARLPMKATNAQIIEGPVADQGFMPTLNGISWGLIFLPLKRNSIHGAFLDTQFSTYTVDGIVEGLPRPDV